MSLAGTSIKKPVLMTMFISAFLVFGLVAFFKLPIDLMPNIEFPFVTVQTIYVGAGPEEIETSVIKPIEEQLSTVKNIKNITSFCAEGMGFIFLEFNLGTDPDLAAIDVKDKLDAILFRLPRDLQKPVVGKFDINAQPIIDLAFTGPQSPEVLRHLADKTIKDRLARIPGVANISVVGGHEREVQLNLRKDRLDAIGSSVQMVAGIVAAQTVNIPGGHVSANRTEYTVRVAGEFDNLDQLRALRIPVAKSGGSGGGGNNGGGGGGGGGGSGGSSSSNKTVTVPLNTLGDVVDAFKEVRESARFNKQNSVGISVQKSSEANTVAVGKEVKQVVAELNASLPEGSKVNIAQDRSQFIADSVNDMYVNIAIGVFLTALMLFFFLSDWRLAVISAVTIPGSLIVTFLGMQLYHFSLNFITLMAIGISVGTLVTNAIIVLENISRHRDEGMPVKQAAERGTMEVFVAVLASSCTNIAVFVPLATMQGIAGQFMKSLGITIVVATAASLFLSFTLVPMMAALMLRPAGGNGTGATGPKLSLIDRLMKPVETLYEVALKWCFRHKALVVGASVLLLVGTIGALMPRIGKEFFAKTDSGVILVEVELPSGASISATDAALATIEDRVSAVPEVVSVYSTLGGSGTSKGVNLGGLTIKLVDKELRTRTTTQVLNAMRPMLADIPDAKIVLKETSSMGGGRSEADIQVEVTGDDMHEILSVADSVQALAATVPGLVDVQLSWKAAKPELKFLPERLKLDEYGTNVAGLGMSLRNAMSGYEAAVYREADNEYKIRVQLDERDRNTLDGVENITISTNKGAVPVKLLAAPRYEGGAANINRKNRQRLVSVLANVSQGASGTKAAELKKLTDRIPLKPGYRIYYGGQQERMDESFGELLTAMMLAIVLTYMVLAGSIESLAKPILIMLTLLMGLVGVLWALFLTNNTLSMVSLMSMIMLVGVVVSNAILIIDYAYQKMREGMTPSEAMLEACRTKFVAIIMMNLAIVLSTLPQAMATGSMSAPFAITAIGGIIVSTLMTYFVIPVLFVGTTRASKS